MGFKSLGAPFSGLSFGETETYCQVKQHESYSNNRCKAALTGSGGGLGPLAARPLNQEAVAPIAKSLAICVMRELSDRVSHGFRRSNVWLQKINTIL